MSHPSRNSSGSRAGIRPVLLFSSLVVVLGLVFTGTAQAKLRDYDGTVAGGGSIDLDVVVKKNRKGKFVPKRVEDVAFFNVPISCDEDPTRQISFSTGQDLPVSKKGAFSYTFSSFTASLTGKLTKQATKVTGQVSFGPTDTGGFTNCTTGGFRAWSGHKA